LQGLGAYLLFSAIMVQSFCVNDKSKIRRRKDPFQPLQSPVFVLY